MSRSGYSDYCEDGRIHLYRGAVQSALHGRRGQAFLREMLAALDALPEKRLIQNMLVEDGAVCALGSVGRARGCDMTAFASKDDDDYDDGMGDAMARLFGIARAMAAEIMFENDEGTWAEESPEQRFARMRRWVEANILKAPISDPQ